MKEIQRVLWKRAGLGIDLKGYFSTIEKSLIPGVKIEQFEKDLRAGAGNELDLKFRAAHSSAALAVNTFALFKDLPGDLQLLGRAGFEPPAFEKQLPTGLQGTPPTLDVFLQSGSEIIVIESKFLEYFTPKKAEFEASYSRKKLPWAEDGGWHVKEEAEKASERNLDIAQLVRHYFGISRLLISGNDERRKSSKAMLLYLYWEPDNASDLSVCVQHRKEIEEIALRVEGSNVVFRSLSYCDLWKEWSGIPSLAVHAQNLMSRYLVTIGQV